MRLLDVHSFPPALPEDEFFDRRYAILSHVWGDEFTFADLQRPNQEPATNDKVIGAQTQARRDGYDYIWIDTLCIDKASSSELGEAINSMYRWYSDAAVCYVYLEDLDGCPRLTDADILRPNADANKRYWGALFKESKWFKRGWTLQELIAARKTQFYDKSWNLIGTLQDLAETVAEITSIHLDMLRHQKKPEDYSIAQRMSWAAGRETTRVEDRAYSLLGILDITISIRYGEGKQAFARLQEAIIARDADQTIFAWEKPLMRGEEVYSKDRRESYLWYDPDWSQLLADSPDAFSNAHDIVQSGYAALPYRMTNLGLYITSSICGDDKNRIILNCHYENDPTQAILLNIRPDKELTIRSEESQGQLPPETIAHVDLRERSVDNRLLSRLTLLDVDQAHNASTKPHTYYISRSFSSREDTEQPCKVWLQLLDQPDSSMSDLLPAAASHLDFIPKPPTLKFDSSNRRPDGHTSNITWTLEKDNTATLQDQRLTARLLYSGPFQGTVDVHLGLSNNRAFLALSAPDPHKPRELIEAMVDGSKTEWMQPLNNQLQLEPGLAIRACALRQHFNGQDMYVLKVCIVRTKIARWGWKRTWKAWMTRMFSGSFMDGGCAV